MENIEMIAAVQGVFVAFLIIKEVLSFLKGRKNGNGHSDKVIGELAQGQRADSKILNEAVERQKRTAQQIEELWKSNLEYTPQILRNGEKMLNVMENILIELRNGALKTSRGNR